MEADALKKILVYSVIAVVLGLLFVMVPLIISAETKAGNHYVMPESVSRGFGKLEGSRLGESKPVNADLEILAVSFAIALVAYILFKRRMPHRDDVWMRLTPV
jgi:hypothetical protein